VRQTYVNAWRAAGTRAADAGLIDRLEQSDRRSAHWARSLFAIHDVDAMIALDVPWWTYRAIDAVDAFLATRGGAARVFEYGSGASTVWLAARAASVTSVEHDLGFAEFLAPKLPPNAELRPVPAVPRVPVRTPSQKPGYDGQDFTAYVESIDQADGAFDLVVVDGRARIACARRALPRLAPGGLLLLDDAWRRRYRAGIKTLPVITRHLPGPAPSLPYPSDTALLRPVG
jgi:hypothetical protein